MAKRPDRRVVNSPEDVPSFESEHEEAEFWSEHELGEDMLERMESPGEHLLPPPRAPSKSISLRVDPELLARLKTLATERGVPYQTLLKRFVIERLYEEERRSPAPAKAGRSGKRRTRARATSDPHVATRAHRASRIWRPERFAQTATGLLFPTASAEPADMKRALTSQGVVVDAMKPAPTLLDQIIVVADETVLGLPASTADDVRSQLAGLPFPSAFVLIARLAAGLWPVRDDPDQQLRLMRNLFGDGPLTRRLQEFIAGPRDDMGEQRYVLDEQQLHVLQRLIIEESATGEDETWSAEFNERLGKAWLGVTSVVGEGAVRLRGQRRLTDWLGFLAQNGSYNSGGQPLYALTRAFRIFVEMPRTHEARGHELFCDFDTWLHTAFELTAEELFAVGFAVQASTVMQSGSERELASLAPFHQYLSTTRLVGKWQAAERALSAERSYFVDGFARSRDDPLRLAWEVTPFLLRPLMRLSDGRLCLTAPRAIHSWLTDGWYYRLLDIAIDRGERDSFTAFTGWLFERYVLEVVQTALTGRRDGQGRVHGDYDYAGQKTSDVVVDYGADLILCEVISTRLPLGVRAEADPGELDKYLDRTLLNKIRQLDRVSRDLLSKKANIPGVDPHNVQRIWPVLITAGDLVESEALREWLRQRVPATYFDDPRAQQLTLLGVEDVEILAGLLDEGQEMHDLIRRKSQSDYNELSLARWLTDTRDDSPPRHPAIEESYARLVRAMESALALSRD